MKKNLAVDSSKPAPLEVTPPRAVCPVCGKPSYSRGGIHPQCTMTREFAQLRAAEKAANPSPTESPPSAWGKVCVRCGRKLRTRRMTCDCGYVLAPTMCVDDPDSPTSIASPEAKSHTPECDLPTKPIPDKSLTPQVSPKRKR